MKRRLALLLAVISFWSQPLWAVRPVESLEVLFVATAAEFGLSADLLAAIAKVESGLNPWAVNINGRGYQCLSREEALALAEGARTRGRSFDLGLMQINSWWLDKTGLSLEAALEPQINVHFGGWILKQELERHGNLRRAVGAYHSPRPHQAGPYADRVLAALNREAPSPVSVSVRVVPTAPAALDVSEVSQQSHEMKISGTLSVPSMKVRKRTYAGIFESGR